MSKIIVVDDSETTRLQLRNSLEENGYEVLEAEDGAVGLNVIEANPDAELIICDVNMPEMDGITMVKKKNEQEHLKHITVFMLTTEASDSMKQEGKKAGVKAWIFKPYNPENLLSVINKLLKK